MSDVLFTFSIQLLYITESIYYLWKTTHHVHVFSCTEALFGFITHYHSTFFGILLKFYSFICITLMKLLPVVGRIPLLNVCSLRLFKSFWTQLEYVLMLCYLYMFCLQIFNGGGEGYLWILFKQNSMSIWYGTVLTYI